MAATRPGTTCIDFEGLPDPPAEYTVGQSIPLGAITANVASFHQEDGSLFDGRCHASTYGYTDGSGKELAIFGVNVEFLPLRQR